MRYLLLFFTFLVISKGLFSTQVMAQNSSAQCRKATIPEITDYITSNLEEESPNVILLDTYRYLHNYSFKSSRSSVIEAIKNELAIVAPEAMIDVGPGELVGVLELPFMKIANLDTSEAEADILKASYEKAVKGFCEISGCCSNVIRPSFKVSAFKLNQDYLTSLPLDYRRNLGSTLFTAVLGSLNDERTIYDFLLSLVGKGDHASKNLVPTIGLGSTYTKALLASANERRFQSSDIGPNEKRTGPQFIEDDFDLYHVLARQIIDARNTLIPKLARFDELGEENPKRPKNIEKMTITYLDEGSISTEMYNLIRKDLEAFKKNYPLAFQAAGTEAVKLASFLNRLDLPFQALANVPKIRQSITKWLKDPDAISRLESLSLERRDKEHLSSIFRMMGPTSRIWFVGHTFNLYQRGKDYESMVVVNMDIRGAGNDKPNVYKAWMDSEFLPGMESPADVDTMMNKLRLEEEHKKARNATIKSRSGSLETSIRFNYAPLEKIIQNAMKAQVRNDINFFSRLFTLEERIKKYCEDNQCDLKVFATGDDIIAALFFRHPITPKSQKAESLSGALTCLKQSIALYDRIHIRVASVASNIENLPKNPASFFEAFNSGKNHNEDVIKKKIKGEEKSQCFTNPGTGLLKAFQTKFPTVRNELTEWNFGNRPIVQDSRYKIFVSSEKAIRHKIVVPSCHL